VCDLYSSVSFFVAVIRIARVFRGGKGGIDPSFILDFMSLDYFLDKVLCCSYGIVVVLCIVLYSKNLAVLQRESPERCIGGIF